MPSRSNSIRLFRISGIEVYLHWWWFLVAVYEIKERSGQYTSVTWNIAEYLALFVVVLLHEFGHALACRQVGGTADRIVLWPLGGVAYVNPPQRPGATLWSIAAGPLVNVAFVVVLSVLLFFNRSSGWAIANPDVYLFTRDLWGINIGLLIFNLLPVYPLDGGQILRSLLWFPLGRARSLMAATVIGFIGIAALIGVALIRQNVWLGVVVVYLLMNCWGGLQHARALLKLSKLPRTPGFACPSCKTAPPAGAFWKCTQCGQAFDTFQTRAACPNCRKQFEVTKCLDCGVASPMSAWSASGAAVRYGT
jgi:Zn-dependent protease